MKILVLGGRGMAGHLILHYLKGNPLYELFFTTRQQSDEKNAFALDVTEDDETYQLLNEIRPDIVINAVGILNEDASIRLEESIYINGLLPHKLANYGNELGYKLLHISTDCVFSGQAGNYTEDDLKDGLSIYAMTKNLGEVTGDQHVTIRTSIIGPELKEDGIGLFNWFMTQTGTVQGFDNAFWNGVTTLELAKAIDWIIQRDMSGLLHLASERKVSKYDLLMMVKDVFDKKDVKIVRRSVQRVDKSLVNTRSDFKYMVPDYHDMLMELNQWMKEHKRLYTAYSQG
ncbi:SDR family oxidoreductase [Rossellomorea aquimaris]|uniref:dTDP-4-dehydrorhamnose reductase family protein n=1 Tax=Rossellomorea aquimaris TaxID=189382 RepID=UPI001CD243AB|nr:SDR family oxidoreductase [Rossellomorea aquimaris]MCA1055430.1 SDR family oxidoreductase [Rossellomorea aquimaris]